MELFNVTKKDLNKRVKGFKSAGKVMRVNKSISYTEIAPLPDRITAIEDAKQIFSAAVGRDVKTFAITADENTSQQIRFHHAFVCKPGFHWLAIIDNKLLALNGNVFQKTVKPNNSFGIQKIVGNKHYADYTISQSL